MRASTVRRLSIASLCWPLLAIGADLVAPSGGSEAPAVLPGTEALSGTDDLARRTNLGWQEFLVAEIARAKEARAARWSRDFSSPEVYTKSVEPNRDRLRRTIGVRDTRVPHPRFELLAAAANGGPLAESEGYRVWSVRWPALSGVNGEGVLFQPDRPPIAVVVFVPDADQLPEDVAGLNGADRPMSRIARRLARSGACVVIPFLANRSSRHTGDEAMGIFTNQSQREWIYRQAAPTGRHIIGYEVQKILSAIDGLVARKEGSPLPVGVIGYGEGGLLALSAAAIDPRIDAVWTGGCFQPRESAWREPLYRSVWGLMLEFGDAELASLVAPRALVVELSRGPAVNSPAAATGPAYARSAAPGEIHDAPPETVRDEWHRALQLAGPQFTTRFRLVGDGGEFGSTEALEIFWGNLSPSSLAPTAGLQVPATGPAVEALAARERRTLRELQEHAQARIREADEARNEFFWKKLTPASAADWPALVGPFRTAFAREGIGWLDTPPLIPVARTRLLPAASNTRWTTYEVVLDVAPGAITWGWLLLPAGLKPGERRPVVVCQHGSGGVPADTVEENPAARAHQIYQAYAARLAVCGFVVFAPYVPGRIGGDDYRLIVRQATLLGLSLFSLVNASHGRILEWLRRQPFVAPERIGLYGMSYGSKVAIRAAAAIDGYAAVVCAGDFQDNAVSMSTVRYDRNECMFYADYDLVEWNLANRVNYAELAALIAPRPFMVEFGYVDRAVQLEGAAAEYAKAARLYFRLGVPERVAIEFFEGGHTVPGRGTFDFLDRWLRRP